MLTFVIGLATICEQLFSKSLMTRTATVPVLAERLRRSARRAWRSPWLHPLNDTEAINALLGDLNPRWSLSEVRAELLARIPETPDTVSLLLAPNRLWPGFVAGQHVAITVEIDGVRQQRVYSLSSDPADSRHVQLSVKRQPGGRISNWLHDQLRIGDVVTLGAPTGDFTLPAQSDPLLLLSAGSGITPMRSLLHRLRRVAPTQDIVLLHVCRDAADRLFADDIDTLRDAMPGLRVQTLYSAQHRPALGELLAAVPDYAQRLTYLCGPAGFMASIEQHWQQAGLHQQLRLERFGLAPRLADDGSRAEVRCAKSDRVFTAAGIEALLPAAEAAGLAPAYGCRIGICRTCLCRKRSGVVENLVSGERSGAGDEWIRLCVSAPRSDLELDL